jgi:hypothetical protein
MSDVGIRNNPVSIIAIILLLGSLGFLLGAVPGVLVGAVIGLSFVLGDG